MQRGSRKENMKTYAGTRNEDGALSVTVDGQPLNPRLDLRNHSPTGFGCGYGGSGPAQLALALLADCLNDDKTAVQLHQSFTGAVVAKLPKHTWSLTKRQIDQALKEIRTQNAGGAM